MSKIFLINPNESRILENYGDRYPLPLLYLGAWNRKIGHDVKIFDMNHRTEEELMNSIKENEPDFICLSIYTSPIVKDALRLLNKIKYHINLYKIKQPKYVAGGHHISASHSVTKYFDYVVKYEGERFMEHIEEYPDVKSVIAQKVWELDDLPFPAYDLINMDEYNLQQKGKRTATLITSRGCPYSCCFCNNINGEIRYHSPQRVYEEVKILKEKYGFESFYFLDDTFTFDKDRVYRICKLLKTLNIKFRATTRANLLNDNVVRNLKEAGCEVISIGIESSSNKVLEAIEKRMTIQDNERAIELCHAHGIDCKGFFIIGLPKQTKEDVEKTIRWAKKWKKKGLTSADWYRLVPFPGTRVWIDPEKYGIKILNSDYSTYLQVGKDAKTHIETKWLSENDIEYYVKKARELFENE